MAATFTLSFWLFLVVFLFSIFLGFYIPGSVCLKRLKLSAFPNTILSIITGMSLWGWQGFVFGFLGLRWMTYVYICIFLIIWILCIDRKNAYSFFKNPSRIFIKPDYLLVLLVVVGSLLQILSTFFNGIFETTGLTFCCGLPDSLYHIALTNQIINEFPPTEPGMSGVIVHNYHYMSNLVTADLIRIFHLPLFATLYQYFIILLSVLLGLSAIVFGQMLKLKKTFIRWLVFFLYFSGDMTYLLSFLVGKGFNFTTPFLENALWLWISPPRVFAVIVFFAGLSLFLYWIKQKKLSIGILMAFVFSSLVSFKIYGGVFMAAGMAGLCIYFVLKKQYKMLLPLFLTGILSLILYLPVNAGSGGLTFVGFWQFENFIAQPGLGLIHLEMAREIYAAHHNWFGVARFEFLFIILYLIFVFGTIILGVIQTKKSLALFPKELNIFLMSGFLVCALFGFLFIQQSGGANSVQFLITVAVLGSIYAALACYYWIGMCKGIFKYLVICIIVLLTIPRVIDISHVDIAKLFQSPALTIDTKQMQALEYIKKNTPANSIILVDNLENKPGYWYNPKTKKLMFIPLNTGGSWEGNNSYSVSFLTNRSLFIDGDTFTNSIVQSHGVNTDERIYVEKMVFLDKNPKLMKELLHANSITYIYLGSKTKLAKLPPPFLKAVVTNNEATVFKVL